MTGRKLSTYNLKNLMVLLVFLGLVIGILVANIFFQSYLEQMESLVLVYIKQYEYMQINSEELFIYLLKVRLLTVVILGILGNTRWGIIGMTFYCAWLGFSAGMFIAMVTIQSGSSGMILTLVSLLPQYLLYIPAIFLLFFGILRRGRVLAEDNDNSQEKTRYIGIVVAVITLFLLGIWLETYVNPIFTKKLLKNY